MINKSPARISHVITSVALAVFITVSANAASFQNLDELSARKVRLGTASLAPSLLEKSASGYTWQPETLMYNDTATGNEVWRLTYTAGKQNFTQDISKTHWSANGKWTMFQSNRATAAFNYYAANIYMLGSTDGGLLLPAKGSAARGPAYGFKYYTWSPAIADEFYLGGAGNFQGEGTNVNSFYRNNVSNNGLVTATPLVTTPLTGSRLNGKAGISGDGRKHYMRDNNHGGCTYSVSITPGSPTTATLDNPTCYDNQLNFDYYWGNAPTRWNEYHDNYVSGAVGGVDGVWNYIMPENTNGSWWRARLSGSGANGAPVHTSSQTYPYSWGKEIEPVITVGVSTTARDPWCLDGDSATECANYPSHFTVDRWAHYGIHSKSNRSPYGTSIWDNRLHKTVRTFSGSNQWVQHHDWDAWSDWSVSSGRTGTGSDLANMLTDRIMTQNYLTGAQKVLVYDYSQSNGTIGVPYEATPRPLQSPDGTKVMFNSTFLQATDKAIDLYYVVAYYPNPPQIKGAAKNGNNVTLIWDFNQVIKEPNQITEGAPNFTDPRTYAKRGWPHEINDKPPSPREIDKFRVWVTEKDDGKWAPLGTTTYNNCRGDNECGMWTETEWSYDAAQPVGSTRYYALTSLEYSGLESRSLSNVWMVTLDAEGNITKQGQKHKLHRYPEKPGVKSDFYTVPPQPPVSAEYAYKEAPATADGQYVVRWNAPEDRSMIRYYNIYAKDGSLPFTKETPKADRQKRRIASIPASSDYSGTGTFSYIDWLGATNGSTMYIVTAVDYQGNESQPTGAMKRTTVKRVPVPQ